GAVGGDRTVAPGPGEGAAAADVRVFGATRATAAAVGTGSAGVAGLARGAASAGLARGAASAGLADRATLGLAARAAVACRRGLATAHAARGGRAIDGLRLWVRVGHATRDARHAEYHQRRAAHASNGRTLQQGLVERPELV